ncbi:Flp family type IVb pilin [Aestuariibius sp. 2305UL40-4]|uniref:Flp family type IVb pilin n=1 Tax=Aestuariibius violaceus TaxID=3234132 RepID=UPI00345EF153
MTKFLAKFRKDEDGAVTVDWVVLTALVVGLAIGLLALIETAVDGLGSDIATAIDGVDPNTATP